jgi:hypothetical protein
MGDLPNPKSPYQYGNRLKEKIIFKNNLNKI